MPENTTTDVIGDLSGLIADMASSQLPYRMPIASTRCKPCMKKSRSSTWVSKTWNGLTNFDGDRIWTDGENIYYSYSSTQYVLDKSTSIWSTKTWSGITNPSGSQIWTDGENIYCSSTSSGQYVLNKSTSTWSAKTWTGLTSFLGFYIWTDGDNIYCSNGSTQYVLDPATKRVFNSPPCKP